MSWVLATCFKPDSVLIIWIGLWVQTPNPPIIWLSQTPYDWCCPHWHGPVKAYSYTYFPITNISSICKTINISSIQVHSQSKWGDEAALQAWKWFSTLVSILGRGCLKKNPGVTKGCLVITPPRMLRISRKFSSKGFFWGLPSSPRPKKWVFLHYLVVFTVVLLVLLAVSRTARCDAYHTSLPSTGDLIWSNPRATWLWQHTQSTEKKVQKKGRLWGCRESNSGREIRSLSFYSVC